MTGETTLVSSLQASIAVELNPVPWALTIKPGLPRRVMSAVSFHGGELILRPIVDHIEDPEPPTLCGDHSEDRYGLSRATPDDPLHRSLKARGLGGLNAPTALRPFLIASIHSTDGLGLFCTEHSCPVTAGLACRSATAPEA